MLSLATHSHISKMLLDLSIGNLFYIGFSHLLIRLLIGILEGLRV
jgi:hypothetical protein